MLAYNKNFKANARSLRHNLTDAESVLWFNIRRKQLCGVQFYRQKPIGNYIVDFYAPSVRLVVEIDGGQHFEKDYILRDNRRTHYLESLYLKVLRFDNLQVLTAIDEVLEVIHRAIDLKNPS